MCRVHRIERKGNAPRLVAVAEAAPTLEGRGAVIQAGLEAVAEEFQAEVTRPAGSITGCREALPFAAHCFGLVAMFDVLEHIAAETETLAEVRRVLAPGGWLVLTVPAIFELRRVTKFNLLLLPVIAAARKLPVLRSWGGQADGREFEAGSGGFWNPVLTSVLRAEAGLLHVVEPAGVSLAALARLWLAAPFPPVLDPG